MIDDDLRYQLWQQMHSGGAAPTSTEPGPPLTLDALREIKRQYVAERIPVGVVVRADVYPALLREIEQLKPDVSRDGAVGGLGSAFGLPIYTDVDQQEGALLFYNDRYLRAYLNRWEKPKEWFDCLMEMARKAMEAAR